MLKIACSQSSESSNVISANIVPPLLFWVEGADEFATVLRCTTSIDLISPKGRKAALSDSESASYGKFPTHIVDLLLLYSTIIVN